MIACFGVLVFLLDIFIIFKIVVSGSPAIHKLLWILLVCFLPVLGALAYLVLGRNGAIV